MSKSGTTITGIFTVTCAKRYDRINVIGQIQRSGKLKYGSKLCYATYTCSATVKLTGDPAGTQTYEFIVLKGTFAGISSANPNDAGATGALVECENMGCWARRYFLKG